MASTGLFGDGLFGDEYYSAQIVDANAGPVLTAASSTTERGVVIRLGKAALSAVSGMAMSAATRLRTMALQYLAVSALTIFGRKVWEPALPSPDTWNGQQPTNPVWATQTPGAAAWTKE